MAFDAKQTKETLIGWIRKYFSENGKNCSAVIGISGGKDSSVAAALCVELLGKDRVVGVLMPNGEQSDIHDSYQLIEHFGIDYRFANIGKAAFAFDFTAQRNHADK